MGISLQDYRFIIGRFLPSSKVKVQKVSNCQNYRCPKLIPKGFRILVVILVLNFTNFYNGNIYISNIVDPKNCSSISSLSSSVPIQVSSYTELTNFSARYTYGNRQSKGIKIAHFNKGGGFLATKRYEIESIVSKFHPHILGISEANLFEGQNQMNIKIADYNLYLCPTMYNPELAYSRIVVYVHKSLVCKVRNDLMCDDYSSIWLQVGLPNQKQFLVCQTYREWQHLNQEDMNSKSINSQLCRWLKFLDQWERALSSGLEVLVAGDININHLDWASPLAIQSSQTVKLRPLIDELFQRIFPHSVTQCFTVPTKFMSNQTPTGLDHIYTNRSDKLSMVETHF